VVCVTYRYFGHHVGDPLNYRDVAEVDAWRQRDPIQRFEQTLIGCGALTAEDAERLRAEVVAEIESAVAVAKAGPEPDVTALMEDVYA
jgi:pyruvate dehydrogenase E1 component alpha subunit